MTHTKLLLLPFQEGGEGVELFFRKVARTSHLWDAASEAAPLSMLAVHTQHIYIHTYIARCPFKFDNALKQLFQRETNGHQLVLCMLRGIVA